MSAGRHILSPRAWFGNEESILHLAHNQVISTTLKNLKKSAQMLEYLHFPLWIVKDSTWFAALHIEAYKVYFQYISLLFALPTIGITLYLIAVSRSAFLRLENTLIALWLLANTGWMLNELFELPLTLWSACCFSIGILLAPFYTRLLFRKREVLSAGLEPVESRAIQEKAP